MDRSLTIRVTLFLLLCIHFTLPAFAQEADPTFKKKENRLLICSGGGARGAWGVGLVRALFAKHNGHGYDAVFGTSTGSLMAPYILLATINPLYLDSLETVYTHVTQSSIFNKNPFKIKYDANTGVVTSSVKAGVLLNRIIFHKMTFGESYPLLDLITNGFRAEHFKMIKDANQHLAVGVTNMVTGDDDVVSSNQIGNIDTMDHWIWASANEPLWMSYYNGIDPKTGKAGWFVDGGLRDVIPIIKGLQYAVDNNIENVDVIINNGRQAIVSNWDPTAPGIRPMMGLERVLDVYDEGNIAKDTLVGQLMSELYMCKDKCEDCQKILADEITQSKAENYKIDNKKDAGINIRIYFMDDNVAAKYRDELAFFQEPMMALLADGKNYFINHPDEKKVIKLTISSQRFKQVFKELYK